MKFIWQSQQECPAVARDCGMLQCSCCIIIHTFTVGSERCI